MAATHAYVTGWLLRKCLRLLVNTKIVSEMFDTSIEDEYKKQFAVGDTVPFKYPDRGTIREGLEYVGSSANRRTGAMTIDQIYGTDFDYDSIEKAFQMERSEDEIWENLLRPRAEQLQQEFEVRALKWAMENSSWCVGVLGTTPTALSTLNTAEAILFEQGFGTFDRATILSAQMNATLGQQVLPYMNPTDEVRRYFDRGFIGQYADSKWYRSNALKQHVSGAWAGTVETSSAGQAGNTLALTATTGDTVKKGDKFTLESVYAINPMTRTSTGRLKQFTVLNDATAAASAFASGAFYFSPAIVGPGSADQNVSALPGNGADLTLWPGTAGMTSAKTGICGLVMSRKEFAFLASKELPMPKKSSVEIADRITDPETGIGISIVGTYNQKYRKWETRLDIDPFGFAVKYPEGCVVVASAT